MAQVKVYARRSLIESQRMALSDAIHGALVAAIGLPVEKRFQRFIGLEAGDFIHPGDRSEHYVIVEIAMFEGRSAEAKRALLAEMVNRLGAACGIGPQDIEITITETPRVNWSIRGHNAEDLALAYRIEV
jgi:phenylpyruvate tautomerase PptA (4-oxalocrotonate tautomerase family)